MTVPAISVQELKQLRDQQGDILLLDVREPAEYTHCHLGGAQLMPLGSLPQYFTELATDKPIVVMCHHGGRSAQAVQFLLGQGFERVLNLAGGIDAWSKDIDPSVPRY